jgi:hypothetical protein
MPTEPTTGLDVTQDLALSGSGARSQAYNGENIGKEFVTTSSTGTVAMSGLYKANTGTTASGGPVAASDINANIPTSGQISASNFHGTSGALDPTDFITETVYGKSHHSGTNANGGAGRMMSRGASSSSNYVDAQTSSPVFSISSDTYSYCTNIHERGFDMGILTTMTHGGKGGNGALTALYHSWMVRPLGGSATYTNAAGGTSTIGSSTWTEIYRVDWGTSPCIGGNSSPTDIQNSFKFPPTYFGLHYVQSGTGAAGSSNNLNVSENTSGSQYSGATSNYHMPPLAQTSSTVYTVGDGDGLYSSSGGSNWASHGLFRHWRVENTLTTICSSASSDRQVALNCQFWVPASNTRGDQTNTSMAIDQGFHSFTSPTFVFKIEQDNIHYGSCCSFYIICLHYDMLVNEKDKGIIHVHQVEVGDMIEDGDDWTEVTEVMTEHMREGYYLVDNWLKITNDHPILINDEWFTADQDDFPLDKEYFEGSVPTVYIETESGKFTTYDSDDNHITVSGDYGH